MERFRRNSKRIARTSRGEQKMIDISIDPVIKTPVGFISLCIIGIIGIFIINYIPKKQ